ncbi:MULTISPECIES: radical SAM/SPASM domain-containing protein [Brevibacillus]|uniref:radical SAM/SPASM domain-containing protein n=1 Tax=Brevibacillus TaxID=55080 RepID=UPI000E2F6C78|nr:MULTISPECIES: radical SAM protein [Brevibacillus]MED1786032.1 radical SAM protein [Brevibacillus laterosporus]RFB38103.1 radical SAM protein [Brevibacillus sp. VP]
MFYSTYNSFHKLSNGSYVIVNSLSGAIDTIEADVKEVLDQIKSKTLRDSNEELDNLISYLYKRGYLFDSREQEWEKLIKLRDEMNAQLQASSLGVVFSVCITYMCNLRCPYCFQGHDIHKINHSLSKDEIDSMFFAVDRILDSEQTRGRFQNAQHTMLLYGGEPLLPTSKKTVHEVVHRGIEEYGFRAYAITNGTFLHEYLHFFHQYKEMWDFFQISIDGPKRIHDQRRMTAGGQGTFERIVSNIDLALSHGFKIALRTNVNKDNVPYLYELAELVEQRGWHDHSLFAWQISPVYDHYAENLPNHMPEHHLLIALQEQFGELESFMDKFNATLGTDLRMRTSRIRQALKAKGWSNNPCDSCSASIPSSIPIFKQCSARDHRYYTFGSEGLIYACPETVGRRELAVGSFYPSFKMNSDKHNMWNQDFTTSQQCSSCSISMFCGGGCAYSNLMRNGAVNKPYCNFSHQTVSTYIKLNEDKFLPVSPLNN